MVTSLQNLLLLMTPVLFVADLVQSVFYLRQADPQEGGDHLSHTVFYASFVVFFAAMMFALLANSLPLMWVAIELTTLVSAPLIAYHRTKESLEAMWKYLLICSIGIGLALFGTMLVMHAQVTGNLNWFKAGFAFVLAGYGTKTGLAPFHSWLPDAHSEAPAPVSALLSGALLNCSFFAIVRFREVMPVEVSAFCDWALLSLGILSVATAAVFMVRQTDYKRLLAYSSVEHMGLATILYATLPESYGIVLFAHIAAHSFTKTSLFLTAGNLLLAFGTRSIAAVKGLGVTLKGHTVLWIVGFLCICGMPPSVLFLTELGLVLTAPIWLASTILILLFIIFAAMMKVALSMTMGEPVSKPVPLSCRLIVVPSTLLFAAVLAGIAALVHYLP